MSASSESPGRGRTQSGARTQAILDATYDCIIASGWDKLRMQDVAERASASLSTIYRRWPTKEHLVAAVLSDRSQFTITPSGDPKQDLQRAFRKLAIAFGPASQIVVGMLAAAQESPLLRDALQEVFWNSLRPLFLGPLGELGVPESDASTMIEALMGLLIVRSVLDDGPIDIDALIQDVGRLIESNRVIDPT